MKDKNERPIGPREKDNELLDFVNYQAQEAILNPALPESKKDEILRDAIGTIQKVAERKAVYYGKYGEGRRTRQFHLIYEAANHEEEEQESTPPIIAERNEHLKKNAPEDIEGFTVEGIAERVGINRKILYEWTESDPEFATALGRLKEIQEDDPFKTGGEEDFFVNSMMVTLLLLETRDRHYHPKNQ